MIYLDNAATTKPLCGILSEFEKYTEENWFNPSALYAPAAVCHKKIADAKESLKKAFGSPFHEVFFTASGTESDNTIIFGGAKKRKKMHFITDAGEHAAVYESFLKLMEAGHEVTFIDIDKNGRVCPDDVINAVKEDTALVSIMHVNNETGAINDIAAIARGVKNKNRDTFFHSDGVQAFMRVPVSGFENIDYYSVSAHKIHGLKGTGAVFYKKNTPIKPYIYGGGQENGLRSGTENTFGIEAFKMATEYFYENRNDFQDKLSKLKKAFVSEIKDLEGLTLISPNDGASHIVSVTIKDVRGETLLHSLESEKIYISTGSACSSKKGVSRTAKSLHLDKQGAEGVIRVSFCPFNTEEEVIFAAKKIKEHSAMLSMFTRK